MTTNSYSYTAKVPCGLCGAPTAMTGTKRCDRCWELERRIQDAPALAAQILARPSGSLAKAAAKIRDAFTYDPGHSDLDDEQPIHITVTLGDWRNLNHALYEAAGVVDLPAAPPATRDEEAK
jgi:hypothetical protein